MAQLKYISVRNYLKEQIQLDKFEIGDLLPSENQLCTMFSITRTTARKALDELLKEGYIEKEAGKGSRVIERRQSLGLLSVKGFSDAVGENVKTVFTQKPKISEWSTKILSPINEHDKRNICFSFERIRYVGDNPVMIGKNWFSGSELPDILNRDFINSSFFKTLSQIYFIEIIGSSSEIRAESANSKVANLLNMEIGSPILHISIKFKTSNPKLTIYSELHCNTNKFPIGNNYSM